MLFENDAMTSLAFLMVLMMFAVLSNCALISLWTALNICVKQKRSSFDSLNNLYVLRKATRFAVSRSMDSLISAFSVSRRTFFSSMISGAFSLKMYVGSVPNSSNFVQAALDWFTELRSPLVRTCGSMEIVQFEVPW